MFRVLTLQKYRKNDIPMVICEDFYTFVLKIEIYVNNMRLVRRPWIWFARFRQRRGYGVHSPFAYSFLRGVVYERTPYYAYGRLSQLHPWWVRWLAGYPITCRRLLFRLANFTHPRTIAVVGHRPIEEAYLSAAVPSAQRTEQQGDFIFVANESLNAFQLPPMPTAGMLVAEGIHHDHASLEAWKKMKDDPQTAITFDLYDYGIALFNHDLQKQHYKVNF